MNKFTFLLVVLVGTVCAEEALKEQTTSQPLGRHLIGYETIETREEQKDNQASNNGLSNFVNNLRYHIWWPEQQKQNRGPIPQNVLNILKYINKTFLNRGNQNEDQKQQDKDENQRRDDQRQREQDRDQIQRIDHPNDSQNEVQNRDDFLKRNNQNQEGFLRRVIAELDNAGFLRRGQTQNKDNFLRRMREVLEKAEFLRRNEQLVDNEGFLRHPGQQENQDGFLRRGEPLVDRDDFLKRGQQKNREEFLRRLAVELNDAGFLRRNEQQEDNKGFLRRLNAALEKAGFLRRQLKQENKEEFLRRGELEQEDRDGFLRIGEDLKSNDDFLRRDVIEEKQNEPRQNKEILKRQDSESNEKILPGPFEIADLEDQADINERIDERQVDARNNMEETEAEHEKQARGDATEIDENGEPVTKPPTKIIRITAL